MKLRCFKKPLEQHKHFVMCSRGRKNPTVTKVSCRRTHVKTLVRRKNMYITAHVFSFCRHPFDGNGESHDADIIPYAPRRPTSAHLKGLTSNHVTQCFNLKVSSQGNEKRGQQPSPMVHFSTCVHVQRRYSSFFSRRRGALAFCLMFSNTILYMDVWYVAVRLVLFMLSVVYCLFVPFLPMMAVLRFPFALPLWDITDG